VRPYTPPVHLQSLVAFARSQYERKPVRYLMVSVVAVGLSQLTLLTCTVLLDMSPVGANLTACAVATGPSYMLNRAWVWGRTGGHDVWREVLPFWIIAFIGLGFSTLLVHLASFWSDAPLVTNAANLTAYGVLWVGKYLVLDQLLFAMLHDAEAADDLVPIHR
jgi:putative flippase GtrA